MKEFYLVLPNIRSCHNVGAMFRTGDACGVSKLFLVGYTASPPKIQIDKVSLGAEKWIPWEKRDGVKEVVEELKEAGVLIVGLEKNMDSVEIGAALHTIEKSVHANGIALIVGNEVDGLSDETVSLCDTVAHIPMYGKKESLNVSIAAGIAMYEIKKQLFNNTL